MILDGISIQQYEGGLFQFTIKAEPFIKSLKNVENKRGFVDGIIIKLSKPSKKGVTHIMAVNHIDQKEEEVINTQ